MSSPSPDSLRVQQASLADQPEGLRLIFAHLPAADREKNVAQILADTGSSPLAGLWLGYRGERLASAMLRKFSRGGQPFFRPPAAADQPPQAAGELLARVVAELPSQGVQMAQVLLETDHGPDAQLLSEHGFQNVSNLMYLVSLPPSFPTSPPSDGLEFISYSAENHARLAEIVRRTYVNSLDCPEIDGVREIEDAMVGYRATGEFDPARWIIACRDGDDVGCVLLTDHPRSDLWELIYLGVVPEARGFGFGLAIVRHAQWLTRQAGRGRLVLAVNAENGPAIDMYAAAGFVAWDHRCVYLRIF